MRGVRRALFEVVQLGTLFLAYKAVRLAIAGRVDDAFDNADHVLAVERALHLGLERGIQGVVLHSTGLVVALNRYYVSMHFATMVLFLVWLFVVHREWYLHVRRLLVAATALALLIHAAYPLAPPRMLPGFVDTMAVYGPNAYASKEVVSMANQHAAMPSVHFLWAVIVAYGIVHASRSSLRWLAVAHPTITLFAIVATGNHYWLDAAVAGVLLVVVVYAEAKLYRPALVAATAT